MPWSQTQFCALRLNPGSNPVRRSFNSFHPGIVGAISQPLDADQPTSWSVRIENRHPLHRYIRGTADTLEKAQAAAEEAAGDILLSLDILWAKPGERALIDAARQRAGDRA